VLHSALPPPPAGRRPAAFSRLRERPGDPPATWLRPAPRSVPPTARP
jgi:hypothetical protein